MPPLPWTTAPGADASHDEVVLMASLLRLDSVRRVPGFLRSAMAIRQQVLHADGAVGVVLEHCAAADVLHPVGLAGPRRGERVRAV